ncbi:Trimeric intracellular cation channel type A, partial [Orchesella cincta]
MFLFLEWLVVKFIESRVSRDVYVGMYVATLEESSCWESLGFLLFSPSSSRTHARDTGLLDTSPTRDFQTWIPKCSWTWPTYSPSSKCSPILTLLMLLFAASTLGRTCTVNITRFYSSIKFHGGVNFTRRHPLATWICSLVEIYAGGILASLFLGEPVLGPLKSNEHLVLYTLVWYLVFYCPFDAVYKIRKYLPVKLAFSVMKEIYKVKKVYDGVSHSLKIFHNGYLIAHVVGTVKDQNIFQAYVDAQNENHQSVTPRYGDPYPVYVTESDPIIEIIVQDSNMTLPSPNEPASPNLPDNSLWWR